MRANKIILAGVLLLISSRFANARNQNTCYIKAYAGLTQFKTLKNRAPSNHKPSANKMSSALEAGLGYKLNAHIKADITLHRSGINFKNKRDQSRNEQKIRSTAGFINLYIGAGSFKYAFTPFITAGIGISNNKTTDLKPYGIVYKGTNQKSKAYQLGAGISFDEISDEYNIELIYKYMNLGKAKNKPSQNFGNMPDAKLDAHFLGVGGSFYL